MAGALAQSASGAEAQYAYGKQLKHEGGIDAQAWAGAPGGKGAGGGDGGGGRGGGGDGAGGGGDGAGGGGDGAGGGGDGASDGGGAVLFASRYCTRLVAESILLVRMPILILIDPVLKLCTLRTTTSLTSGSYWGLHGC